MEKVKRDWRSAGLDAQTVALLQFAEKLTRTPDAMCEADVQALRAGGSADEEILDTTLIVSLFNFMNRLTHALGLSGEEAHRSHQQQGAPRSWPQT